MTTPDTLTTLAAKQTGYPLTFGAGREARLAKLVKDYVDSLSPETLITARGDLIRGTAGGTAARYALAAAGNVLRSDGTDAVWGKVLLADLDSGIAPAYVVKYGGTFTTAGGDAAEAIAVAGVAATDVVMVSVKTAGATPRSIVAATAATNAINVTMSGDPSTDHVLQYVVYRAAA